ncbi:MAG: ATP-binding cassette domain-containing protein [Oleiphilaceae bacterium]|nr:ATP-binding cassette domain-containing protein [Oleiphilaceae bacterium]
MTTGAVHNNTTATAGEVAVQPLARFDAVCAGYRKPVVGPVSFTVSAGEILGLAGANGAGKSTLLSALTGTARVFSGHIRRRDGLTVSHHRQRPEQPPELPLCGRELLELMGAVQTRYPPQIEPLLEKPLAALSGGQFQFLQAYACLASQAELVILDEPTNNLDGHAIQALSGLLSRMAPHRAVLLVSHEQRFLQQHCSRIIELPLSPA